MGRVLICHFVKPLPAANSIDSKDIATSHGTINEPSIFLN